MKIDYDILRHLLDCNKNIKLKFINNTNTLEIYNYSKVICTIELGTQNIQQHSEIIYSTITNLENITLYIPKIYIKE